MIQIPRQAERRQIDILKEEVGVRKILNFLIKKQFSFKQNTFLHPNFHKSNSQLYFHSVKYCFQLMFLFKESVHTNKTWKIKKNSTPLKTVKNVFIANLSLSANSSLVGLRQPYYYYNIFEVLQSSSKLCKYSLSIADSHSISYLPRSQCVASLGWPELRTAEPQFVPHYCQAQL